MSMSRSKPDEDENELIEFNVDDLLKQYVGPFGLWQWLITLLCILASPNMTTFPVFVNAVPKVRCRMEPGYEKMIKSSNYSFDQIVTFIGPSKGDDVGCLRFSDQSDLMSILQSGTPPHSNVSTEPCPHGYIYQTDDFQYPSTVVEEYTMVCGQEWLAPTGTFIYIFGMMVGFLVGGWLGDKYGRRPTAIGFSLPEIIASIVISTAPNHYLYHTGRFFAGISMGGKATILRLIPIELTLARYRGFFTSAVIIGSFSCQRSFMTLMAYLIHDWRWLHAASMAPAAFSLLFFCFLPESPRWLCSQQRFTEALAVLLSGAHINKLVRRSSVKDSDLPHLDRFNLPQVKFTEKAGTKNGCCCCNSELFVNKEIIKSVSICSLLIAVQSSSAFGILLYARIIKTHIYLLSFLNAVASIPGPIIASILCRVFRFRRLPLIVLYSISGVSLMIGGLYAMLVKDSSELVLNISCNVGIVFFSASMIMLMIYTTELFPSSIRTRAFGFAGGFGRGVSSLATFINQLDYHVAHGFPVVIYASLALIQTGLLMLLRNTSGESLPDRIIQVEGEQKKSSEKSDDGSKTINEDCNA